MRWLVLAVLVVSTGLASAQAPGETPPIKLDQVHAHEGKKKSLLTAYMLSIAATSVPMGVALATIPDDAGPTGAAIGVTTVSAAIVLGPTAGHWYAGGDITPGLVMRTGSLGAIFLLAMWDPNFNRPEITAPGLILSVAILETGLIWDLVTLPRAVRRYNKTHATVVPLVTSGPTGSTGGLALAGSF